MSSPYVIVLSDGEEAVLAARARSARSEYRDRLRARIVLAAAAGASTAVIAAEAGVCLDTVRKWRRRLAASRLPGLKDAPRSGRPPVFTAAGRAGAVALACALPAESGVPLPKWSCPELARELAARCQVAASASTIGRWLAGDALKPWQHRSLISVRDPGFAAKAARVLDLYAGTWDGKPLGENDYVICADEKTSIQARCRCHPALPSGNGSHHPSSVSTALYPRAASASITLDFPVPDMPVSSTRFTVASLRPQTGLPVWSCSVSCSSPLRRRVHAGPAKTVGPG
jgi:transposase